MPYKPDWKRHIWGVAGIFGLFIMLALGILAVFAYVFRDFP